MKTFRIIVSGRVQGVFFRANAAEAAKSLSLKGYAKNLPEGDVEIMAQGDEEKLEEFLKFCRKGPPAARVDNVKISNIRLKEKFTSFDIQH